MNESVEKRFQTAAEQFAEYQVDVNRALKILDAIQLSIPCWQADDVIGLENSTVHSNWGGIMATGNYPGRARTLEEIQTDLEQVLTLIPGTHRVNLHAMYGDFSNNPADRDAIEVSHFNVWMDWARSMNIGLDFNSTYFAHPKADSGFTLSNSDPAIRTFWTEHGKRCRAIAAALGKAQGSACVHNTWIPDGSKDLVVDKWIRREQLKKSLDEIYAKPFPDKHLKDSMESKLFGLGSETFVVGSYDFYLSYALTHHKIICLDMGHFHPTESVADKLSAILQFSDEVLLHMTRSVRWDSDHVPVLNQDLCELTQEIVRNHLLDRVILALDFFDASINRIAAYVLGVRAVQQALMMALLEPALTPNQPDKKHQLLTRAEHAKTLPFGPVWDYYCASRNVPPGARWLQQVEQYEQRVLTKRD